jgi:hypothetical protein
MIGNAKKLSFALLVALVFVATVAVVTVSKLHAQTPQSNSADKPQAAATPADAPTPAKPQTPPPKASGMVWVNTDTACTTKKDRVGMARPSMASICWRRMRLRLATNLPNSSGAQRAMDFLQGNRSYEAK